MNKLININIRNRNWKERYRPYLSLYPEFGELFNLADKFAGKNGVFGLKWKCKTWDKINKDALSIVKEAIKSAFGENVTVSYNRKLGCSCGCSPGFKVVGSGHTNQEAFGFIYIDMETVDAFEKKLVDIYQPMLDKEKELHAVEELELAV